MSQMSGILFIIVEIISKLEKEFNVKITSDMIMDLEDVSDIVSLIEDLTE